MRAHFQTNGAALPAAVEPTRRAISDYIGHRMRLVRDLTGLTPHSVANRANLPSVETLTRAEAGQRHITADELWRVARVLAVPVQVFFDGLDGSPKTLPPDILAADAGVLRLAGRIARLDARGRDRLTLSLCQLEAEHDRRKTA